MKKTLLLLPLFLFVFSLLSAQADTKASPFVLGEVREIESAALGETRKLNIYLPQDYEKDETINYPVIYLLDGSAHEDYVHIVGLVQFLNMYELMPKTIVVGIANVDRYRDFTHPSDSKADKKSLPQGGGSAKFIQFVKDELMPMVEANYQTNETRTIIGQSLGGLVATEILMTHPEMFSHYLIVSPSLWWGKKSLVNGSKAYFKAHQDIKARVFVSLGKEHPVMHKVADKLVASMKDAGNPNLSVAYEPVLDEDHATILHTAAYKGLKWLFPVPKEKKK